jgi:FkbM family methyltransferase
LLGTVKRQWALVREQPARRTARLLGWHLWLANIGGATVKIPGADVTFFCPPEHRGQARLAFVLRESGGAELSSVASFVPPGGTAIDVGAHYGLFTAALATRAGPHGSVIAFEPLPHAVRICANNLEINDVHAEIVCAAVGSTSGTLYLSVQEDPSRTFISQDPAVGPPVEVVTLDDHRSTRSLARLDLLKVDVEGNELRVFEGALRLLETYRPKVYFEHIPALANRAGLSEDGAPALLSTLGYSLHTFGKGGSLEAYAGGPANILALMN